MKVGYQWECFQCHLLLLEALQRVSKFNTCFLCIYVVYLRNGRNLLIPFHPYKKAHYENKNLPYITLIDLLAVVILIFQACKKEEEETNQPPSCTITSPSEGDTFTQGETITISVNANDADGSITEVVFFVDGVEKSSAASSPYNWSWDTCGENIGNHTLKATSTDNDGASASDEVTIVIIEQAGPPEAAFKAFPTCGVPPLSVDFTDQSTKDPTSW